MKKILALTLFTGSLLLIGCFPEDSADVNQDRIYTTYELFYDANTDKTVVSAQFRFGNSLGTLLELFDPAFVTFNDVVLSYRRIFIGHKAEFAGKITDGTFYYVDIEGKEYTNTTPTVNETDFPDGFTTITKGQANEFSWAGEPLTSTESISLHIIDENNDDVIFYTSETGTTSIIMGKDEIDNLSVGTYTLMMERKNQADPAQAPEAGGVVRSRFRPDNIQVEVVE